MSLYIHNKQNIYTIYSVKVRSSYFAHIVGDGPYVGQGANVEKMSGGGTPQSSKN